MIQQQLIQCTLDRCGACFINRLDVFGNDGSVLLETIQNYNILYNYLIDFQMNAIFIIWISYVC